MLPHEVRSECFLFLIDDGLEGSLSLMCYCIKRKTKLSIGSYPYLLQYDCLLTLFTTNYVKLMTHTQSVENNNNSVRRCAQS